MSRNSHRIRSWGIRQYKPWQTILSPNIYEFCTIQEISPLGYCCTIFARISEWSFDVLQIFHISKPYTMSRGQVKCKFVQYESRHQEFCSKNLVPVPFIFLVHAYPAFSFSSLWEKPLVPGSICVECGHDVKIRVVFRKKRVSLWGMDVLQFMWEMFSHRSL